MPPEIDLSDANTRDEASVTIPGLGTPGASTSVTIPSGPVEWGLTIPTNSGHRDRAIAFVANLLGPAGRASLAANGPASIAPARVSVPGQARLPSPLRSLTTAR